MTTIVPMMEKVGLVNFDLGTWQLKQLKTTIVILQSFLGIGNFFNHEIPNLSGNGAQRVPKRFNNQKHLKAFLGISVPSKYFKTVIIL